MSYSENVHYLQLGEKELYLIGTAHISQESIEEVIHVIETENPDTVCVELCASRYESLSSKERWQSMNIFKVIREQKTFLLLANLILASFQKKLGEKLGVQPGKEMLEAIDSAKKINAEVVLADRDIQTTLRKTWRSLPFREKWNVMSQLMMSMFVSEEISKEDIEKMKTQDVLSEALEIFANQSPMMKRTLIDERDQYLAEKIRTAPGNKIVAVVGAGHVPGIRKELFKENDLNELNRVPPPKPWGKFIKWGIPLVILGIILYGFSASSAEVSIEMIKRWVLINGTLSAIGAAIAFGHPFTIVSAFIAAPITSLNPTIAAGWVAGLVEATVHKPQVRDFERLSTDISEVSGFWKNKITRILLVVIFANLGSFVGTFVGGAAIVELL